MKLNRKNPLLAVFASFTLAAPSAFAQSGNWIAVTSSNWSTASNWSTDPIVPGTMAGDVISINSNIGAANTVTINASNQTAGILNIGDPVVSPATASTHAFTLARTATNILILDNGGTDAQINKTGTIADTISAPIQLNSNLTVNTAGQITLGGGITATGGNKNLTKTGTSALVMNGTNNYGGTTTVSAGTARFVTQVSLYNNAPASWTPANINVKSGATLAFNVGGGSQFTDTSISTLLTNLAVSPSATEGMNAGSNFAFNTDTTPQFFTLTGLVTDSTGANGGARGLQKLAVGTLVLTNANTYTGPTTISGGTLRLENTTASSAITLSGATSILQIATDTAYSGPRIVSTAGTIVSDRLTAGAGLTHTLSGVSRLGTGLTNVTAGANVTSGTAAIQFASLDNDNGTTANFGLNPTTANVIIAGGVSMGGGSNAGTANFTLGGTGSVNSIGGAIVNGARVTANLIKSGTSTWTLSGANTHTGATSVTAGTLTLANSLALQNSSVDTTASIVGTATDGFNTSFPSLTVGGLTGNKNLATVFITGNYSTVTALTLNPGSNVTHSYAGNITNGAADMTITKINAGTQTLTGTNTYTGGTIVTAGTLRPTLAPALAGYTSLGKVVFNGGIIAVALDETALAGWSTAQVDSLLTSATKTSGSLGIDTAGGNATFSPISLSGAIGLTKLGANTLTLTGSNTHTGNTTISAGILRLENTSSVQNSAVVSVGANTLQVATDTAFSSSTPLSINGGTIVSDRTTPGAGLTHGFGNLAVANATQNFTAGTNVTSGTAAIQLASITNSSGGGGSVTLNPTTANLIVAGGYTSLVNAGSNNLNLGGTSLGNSIGGAVSNGTRATQNVIKSNTSTWTLNGVNTFTGNTTVNNGTLTLSNAASPANTNTGNDVSTVTISDNGTSFLNLTYTGTDVVASLIIGTTPQAPGVYGKSGSASPIIGIPQITGDGTLTVGTGFSAWITGPFANGTVPSGQQGPNQDPDNDGISNLVEFAIANQDPTVPVASIGTFDGTTLSFTKRQPLATSLTYAIQASTDLGTVVPWAAVTGTPPTYVNDATTISYTLTPGTPAKNFLRLQVISN
jgi:fibronectin-binding autotransporter adhesin